MLPSIDHLNRYVSDVARFIKFYEDVLGYQPIDRGIKGNGKPYAILKGNGHELFISEKDDFAQSDKNFRHIGYTFDNVDGILEMLKSKGIADPLKEVIVKPYSRQFYIEDPDGFEIDIIQWTDKKGFYENLEKKDGKE